MLLRCYFFARSTILQMSAPVRSVSALMMIAAHQRREEKHRGRARRTAGARDLRRVDGHGGRGALREMSSAPGPGRSRIRVEAPGAQDGRVDVRAVGGTIIDATLSRDSTPSSRPTAAGIIVGTHPCRACGIAPPSHRKSPAARGRGYRTDHLSPRATLRSFLIDRKMSIPRPDRVRQPWRECLTRAGGRRG